MERARALLKVAIGEPNAPGHGERVFQWTPHSPNHLTAALTTSQKV